jgi:hypothetical protein
VKPKLDPEVAVQSLVWVMRSANLKETSINPAFQDHFKMICNFPEARGKIAFDDERGMLLLLDWDD